jgi:enamine deaminase RidA (YjgF/YER057c/UK114 family)
MLEFPCRWLQWPWLRLRVRDAAVRPGDGQVPSRDIETQTEASLKAVQHCLESAGTSLDKVVMVRVYASNAGFYAAINRVYARFFAENPPSRTFVPMVSWPMEFGIEIECVALA